MSATILESLKNTLRKHQPLSDADVARIMSHGETKTFHKNEIVFLEGRYNAFEYFQLSGISHRYNDDENGNPVTTGIYREFDVVTPHFARTRNNQSIFSLQAISSSTFFQVPIGMFDELRMNYPAIRDFGQCVVEKEFKAHLHFEVLFRTYTAKDRLLYFREAYPMMENLIPHTVIASFLGITPVSFSRLRNELARK